MVFSIKDIENLEESLKRILKNPEKCWKDLKEFLGILKNLKES